MDRAISEAEGHFIAGFIEGEAHLGIVEANGGQSFRCLMSLRVRDDDAPLLTWLRMRTGVGRLHAVPARRTSKPQAQWLVQTQAGCTTLVELLTRFPLRGRKTREFEIWRRAVELWLSGAPERAETARRHRHELLESRRFRPPKPGRVAEAPDSPEALDGYLHGLLCAEGSFALDRSRTAVTVHLRQDDRPLLSMLAQSVGVGVIRDHRAYPPTHASTTWRVSRHDDIVALAARLDPQRMRGRKAAELAIWLRAVNERRVARAEARPARVDDLIAEFRVARQYRPGTLRANEPARQPRREDALRILHDWADAESGALSCTRYARAARASGWPTRNTITAWFGSWAAALEAAGLGDRAASTREVDEARAAGSATARAAYDEVQRRRVLTTLRFALNTDGYGTLPTAMQFFRWRLINAPATPTQATVYRLFPGGWPAVLAAYETWGGQPSRA